jgi:hypothetical protein
LGLELDTPSIEYYFSLKFPQWHSQSRWLQQSYEGAFDINYKRYSVYQRDSYVPLSAQELLCVRRWCHRFTIVEVVVHAHDGTRSSIAAATTVVQRSFKYQL